MGKSKIEWTDQVWNPVWGCSHVSPGCVNCYAEAFSLRYKLTPQPWEPRFAEQNVQLHRERLLEPFGMPEGSKVFACSMSDMFHDLVPDWFIERMWAVMAARPELEFQVLTKRPERMQRFLAEMIALDGAPFLTAARLMDLDAVRQQVIAGRALPLSNVIVGTSAEDQMRLDERLPVLREVPAAQRFLSVEPLLGPVDFRAHIGATGRGDGLAGVDWVIIGGESHAIKSKARPCEVAWIESLVQQLSTLPAPPRIFVKQVGSRPLRRVTGSDEAVWDLEPYPGITAYAGREPEEWPEAIRIREWPTEPTDHDR